MKEWYLIGSQTKPNAVGGFENQAFTDCKDDAFNEAADTEVGTTVEVCNYNLTERRTMRCIVQNNVADTLLQSMERTILFPIGTVKAGEYVFFDNRYWLITGYPGNNRVYEKVTAVLCQYKLRWQNDKGQVIERWANVTTASKYDIGETGNRLMVVPTDDFTVLIPNDKHSVNIDDKRVFIDTNRTNPIKVFKITRNNDVFYDYGEHGGVLSLIAHRDEFNAETDNQRLMICDYIPTDNPKDSPKELINNDIIATIKTSSPVVRVNTAGRIFYANFYNHKGEKQTDVVPHWIIECDFPDDIGHTEQDDSITLFTYKEELIDRTFTLKLTDENGISNIAEQTVTIDGII